MTSLAPTNPINRTLSTGSDPAGRQAFYDVLKAVAIGLVALGHALQTLDASPEPGGLRLGITLFHMPLFIAISGFFFARSVTRHAPGELIRTRFVHLMFPALSWGFLNMLLAVAGKLAHHRPLEAGYLLPLLFASLWFLPTLFVLSVIGVVLARFLKGPSYWLGWLAVWGGFMLVPKTVPLANGLDFLCPFFALGIAGARIDWSRLHWGVAAGASVVFAASFHFFTWDMSMYRMQTAGGGGYNV